MALEARPRHSQSRTENIAAVSKQLVDAGHPVDAVEFSHLVKVLEKEEKIGALHEHPITLAARAVGMNVHWEK